VRRAASCPDSATPASDDSSLRALHLQVCPLLTPSKLHHIISLSSLQRLQLANDSFSMPLHQSTLQLLALKEGRSRRT